MHWTRTLSQDSCSLMSQCITPTFCPFFCLAHIVIRPVQSDEENAKNAKIQVNLCPIFVLVLDFFLCVFFFFFGGGGGLTRGS